LGGPTPGIFGPDTFLPNFQGPLRGGGGDPKLGGGGGPETAGTKNFHRGPRGRLLRLGTSGDVRVCFFYSLLGPGRPAGGPIWTTFFQENNRAKGGANGRGLIFFFGVLSTGGPPGAGGVLGKGDGMPSFGACGNGWGPLQGGKRGGGIQSVWVSKRAGKRGTPGFTAFRAGGGGGGGGRPKGRYSRGVCFRKGTGPGGLNEGILFPPARRLISQPGLTGDRLIHEGAGRPFKLNHRGGGEHPSGGGPNWSFGKGRFPGRGKKKGGF